MIFLSLNTLYAQDCKVLLKTINETYHGDCKKGKAHGNGVATGLDSYKGEFKKGYPEGLGTYTWQNGNVFKGSFKNGKKEGKGTLIYKADSTLVGFWKKDNYIGVYEKPYKKNYNTQNITGYSIKQIQQNIQSIRVFVKEDDKNVKDPNIKIVLLGGNYQTETPSRDYFEIKNVAFPIKAKVYYNQEYVEFEIFNSGLWEVKLEITNIKGLGN